MLLCASKCWQNNLVSDGNQTKMLMLLVVVAAAA